jgi:2-dehydropantoate 2-reductase
MKVLIFGAGVIGQIYGGRLAQAGHAVTLLARAPAAESLMARGIAIRTGGDTWRCHPPVVVSIPPDGDFDIVLVCVRRDQVAAIMPELAGATAGQVVFLLNQCTGLAEVRDQIGADRVLFGFPGVGGQRTADGTIEYLQVKQQHTTIERRDGREEKVVGVLRAAGFAVDLTTDMDGWLKTHAVFITAVGAAILAAGGDSIALAADRARVADLVAAAGEGFRALARQGVGVTPAPLRLVFTVVPRFAAVRYWQAQLRGTTGTQAIAPHIRATRDTEFRSLVADVRQLIAGHGPAPHLDRLLTQYAPSSATSPT